MNTCLQGPTYHGPFRFAVVFHTGNRKRTFYLYLVRPEVPRSLQSTEPGALVLDTVVLCRVGFVLLLLIEYDPSTVPCVTQLG
jgi:hypothetical protein